MDSKNIDRERQALEQNVFKLKIAALLLIIVAAIGFLTSPLPFDDRFYAMVLLFCFAALILLLREPFARLARADQKHWERVDAAIRAWFKR